jgi:hypothetical protein
LALDGSEWSASHPCCFTPGERTPIIIIHWIGCWVGPITSLDVEVKKKNPFTAPARNQILVVKPMA